MRTDNIPSLHYSIWLMRKPTEYYQHHLDKVSRSFAACIAQLEQPLRRYVSLTYLVCRVLDSVEDARWKRLSEQLTAFKLFNGLLDDPKMVKRLDLIQVPIPAGLTPGEEELIKDAKMLFEDLHDSPVPVKKSIQSLVKSMSYGMSYFAKKRAQGGLRLSGLQEVNQYCFFVAGLVGETLASLLTAVDPRVGFNKELVLKAHHFGLFLQKVNLLKDQFSDEKEGRFLVPSRKVVYASLEQNANSAWEYIKSIPVEQKGYRVFCLWSFFLGLKTLPLLKEQSCAELEPKLPREETLKLFQLLESKAHSLDELQELFDDCIKEARFDAVVFDSAEEKDMGSLWFEKYYNGMLTQKEFAQLGMVPSV